MAETLQDFYVGDDFEAILDLLDNDFLENEELNLDLDNITEKASGKPAENNTPSQEKGSPFFVCRFNDCQKKYKTEQGLTRHVNNKHLETVDEEITTKILQADKLKEMFEENAKRISDDECFSEKTHKENIQIYKTIEHILKKYKGDAESFYSSIYDVLVNTFKFENLNVPHSALLLNKTANSILCYTDNSDDTIKRNEPKELRKNEIYSLQYLGGAVFSKVYQKIRAKRQTEQNELYLSILYSTKVAKDESQKIVNARNRGGLWTINGDAQNIFLHCEKVFREHTKEFTTTIDSEKITKSIISDKHVLGYYKNICESLKVQVDDEITINLLEIIIGLYIRIRSHSYAKDVKENFKLSKGKGKKRSLRTEIKKASSTKVNGH